MSIHKWMAEREAAFAMENAIRDEKLSQGIDGLEWLVIQTNPTQDKKESLARWLRFIEMYRLIPETVMKDAIKLGPEPFYTKYQINWWITIEDTITYLALLRQRDYDNYFRFITTIERS